MPSDSNGSESLRTGDDTTQRPIGESGLAYKCLQDYVVNSARGCRHGCTWCYVPATPGERTRQEILEEEVGVDDLRNEWGDWVLYRSEELAGRLAEHLDRKQTWTVTRKGQGVVGFSFATDCFQDRQTATTTLACIAELVTRGYPVRILTRNPKQAWDASPPQYPYGRDMLLEAGRKGLLTIGSSIPTFESQITSALEPGAPHPELRYRYLQKFADAGVPVFVSMSPTYPTLTQESVRAYLARFDELDPGVIFHEPINPRGSNFEASAKAANEAGLQELGTRLAELGKNEDKWARYAIGQFRHVQQAAADSNVPIHLWPDPSLPKKDAVADRERIWLQKWLFRQSPEEFPGRNTTTEMPALPATLTSY